jgi:uncharacterized LabA/DUF88 family protein
MIMDIAIAVDAMALAERIDEMVLFSGDTVIICQPASDLTRDNSFAAAIAPARAVVGSLTAGFPAGAIEPFRPN